VVNVRFWHKADIPVAPTNVRFLGQSGHQLDARQCLLLTQSGRERTELLLCNLIPEPRFVDPGAALLPTEL